MPEPSSRHLYAGRHQIYLAQRTALNCYLPGPDAPAPFPQVAQSFRIQPEVFDLDGTSHSQEIAYAVTSLSPERADQARLMALPLALG